MRIFHRRANGGQAIVEYVIVAGIMVAMLSVLTLFMETFREYSARILELVSSDYP